MNTLMLLILVSFLLLLSFILLFMRFYSNHTGRFLKNNLNKAII